MRICNVSVGLIAYAISNDQVHANLFDDRGRVRIFSLARNTEVIPALETLMDALRQPLTWLPSQRREVIRAFVEDWGLCLLPPVDCLDETVLRDAEHFAQINPLRCTTRSTSLAPQRGNLSNAMRMLFKISHGSNSRCPT